MTTYLLDSLAWSVVWLLLGYVLGLLDPYLRDAWKRHR